MRRDAMDVDTPGSERLEPLTLADVEAIRLLLGGGSVIDWAQLAFDTPAAVNRFLALHGMDGGDETDRGRLRYVYNEAIAYVEENLPHLRPREHLGRPDDIREIFTWAGQTDRFRRRQMLSCVVLKLMHVIHHMEAADLKFKTAVSEAELLDQAEASILRRARPLRDGACGVRSFYGSRKSRSSTIAKLVAKSDNIAATIFDKLRFRIVVNTGADLVPVLAWMTQHLFPFNYVIPGQSHNNLVDPRDILGRLSEADLARAQHLVREPEVAETGKNEFSGSSYRAVNFIVDYPVLLPAQPTGVDRLRFGRVVFVMVEFQVLDAMTAARNEEGENAHHLYKARQWHTVEQRLLRGEWTRDKA